MRDCVLGVKRLKRVKLLSMHRHFFSWSLILIGVVGLLVLRIWLEPGTGVYNTEEPSVRMVIIGISIFIVGYFGRLLKSQKTGWGWWGSILLLSGGLANTLERVFFANVYDYIYYPLLQVYGNMADIWIGAGIGLLLIDYGIEHYKNTITER
jgi:hypothetical protein